MSQLASQRTAAGPAVTSQSSQFLTFVLGPELFALDILGVREIIEYAEITTVPMMPDYVRGVLNLRGAVVPVIDLQVRFGRQASAVGKRTCVIIIEALLGEERQTVGLVVDAVNAVLDIPASDIEPPPSFGASVRTEFIQGVGKVEGRFVILLDLDNIMSAEELLPLENPEELEGGAEPAADPAEPVH